MGCSSLKEVDIPSNVTYIGNSAFWNCSALRKVNIQAGDAPMAIKNSAFDGHKVESIVLPERVTEIDEDAFGTLTNHLVLTVTRGSYAETYAKEHGIDYIYEGEDADHNHSYDESITIQPGCVTRGERTYTCSECGNVNLTKKSSVYNGKNQKPSVSVKDSKGNILCSTDYTVSYPKSMKSVGVYSISVKLKGNYKGTVKKSFTILPKGTTLSRITAKKKGFSLKWKKQATQTTGYEVAYSTSSKFPKNSTSIVPVKKNKTTSKTVSKLKAKKKYYVRIRTYKTVKGKKYYSGWSKSKTVTTKK